ncbi:hypothetical protein HBDW_19180 [Herbaspirillum sp. DW155]|uniref:hypothetical protein n=1 Tax=Herbaspirillum sp. DW155 TaxID=3095609 RepID=UPI00308547C6|nr:hypothetical protein HBDW_19180 [Herbaspirillum sp. DW155]
MNQQLFVNDLAATLSGAISNSATSATLLPSGIGSKFPTLANGDYVLMTLTQAGAPANETSREVVKVTAVSGDVITFSRGYEGAAQAWAANDKCEERITASYLNATSLLRSSRMAQALGSISGANTIDLQGGSNISLTVAAALTLAFTNLPASGNAIRVVLTITNGGAFAITWPANTRWMGAGVVGSAPTLVSSGTEKIAIDITNFGGTVYYDAAYLGRVA